MNGLDLFSGYGGLTLSLAQWVRPVAYCELDRYAQAILLSRISEGKLPPAPIWDDITTFPTREFQGAVDIVYGGFPCQDISVAGNGVGLAGKRSGLFFELCRVVQEVSPRFVFLENVPAIRTRGLREVVRKLTDMGFDCRWTCVSAKEVGAPHLRKRWFLLANSQGSNDRGNLRKLSSESEAVERSKDEYKDQTEQFSDSGAIAETLAHSSIPHSRSQQLREQSGRRSREGGREKTLSGVNGKEQSLANPQVQGLEGVRQGLSGYSRWWEIEPRVGRVVDGGKFRSHRIRALGNGVVPAQASKAFQKLIGG